MPDRPGIIVAGYLVRYPVGGHALSVLHYLMGLLTLGFDVTFVEEYGWARSCYDPSAGTMSDDPSYGLAYLGELFKGLGVPAWCFVDAHGRTHGIDRDELRRRCEQAAALLSIGHVTWLPEFAACRSRIFLDTDPGFTQFEMPATPVPSEAGYASPFDFHHHFTFGTRIGLPDCPIPRHGIDWRPTRPAVALELLPPRYTPDAPFFTTVMSWRSREPILYEGVEYGQKDVEFLPLISLPAAAGRVFEVAVAGKAPRDALRAAGWRVVDPRDVTRTPWSYRDYIATSRGEFSVAVNLEVRTRSGWFSDRTAAYLASGKPVIVQDTGFSDSLPCGDGLLPFRTFDDVVVAVDAVSAEYDRHCKAARRIAEEYFDARTLLAAMLRDAEVDGAPH